MRRPLPSLLAKRVPGATPVEAPDAAPTPPPAPLTVEALHAEMQAGFKAVLTAIAALTPPTKP